MRIIKTAVLALSIVGFLGGCASTSSISRLKVDETFRISGTKYVSAVSLAELYNLDYYQDTITKKVVLARDDKEARFMVESSIALLNEDLRDMKQEAKFHQGSVIIPQAFAYKTLAPFFKTEAKATTKKIAPAKVTGLAIKKVVIDPGHGGKDPGAIGRGGLMEKDVVLVIAKNLKRKMEKAGIEVIMTRESDRFVSLGERARFANSKDVDFFISIHANASRSKWVSGVEVFYVSEAIDEDNRSHSTAEQYDLKLPEDVQGKNTPTILWDLIHRDNRISAKSMAELICNNLCKNLSQKNRGVKQARFYVLKGTNIPAILVEVGFISNPAEEKKLKDGYYCNKVAQAVADGVYEYNHTFGENYYTRH
ncbi:MAG: N-acetylmuramoyl-L-alanine amidase [Candidatus Omnitrophica bacterium]|nr:N-acetylmuramoyl-L-alanine amidase [Candidatus Omnitrophota bacterium]